MLGQHFNRASDRDLPKQRRRDEYDADKKRQDSVQIVLNMEKDICALHSHRHTRFHATRAAPRDVAALAGVHRHVEASESAGGMAGATMQGDDALVADLAASA